MIGKTQVIVNMCNTETVTTTTTKANGDVVQTTKFKTIDCGKSTCANSGSYNPNAQ
ncbi:hypothetical protein CDEST_09007 [Colletotrichum destructivum]|uniref:Pectate lyase n=1 Tax=Colletotrichum destructivum TaxID=34406 RepID=A0AAX4IMJ3_9PEZI|nr:hypothetical protein CDEST_09007 [Colletotrichum destructivum]